MARPRRIAPGLLTIVGIAVFLLVFNYKTVLRGIGDYLVEAQSPEKADAILVLAGDWRGKRILHAAELVRSGYAPVILVSGPMELYGANEADLAIQYATRHGVPASVLQPIYISSLSTNEEAHAFAAELRKRGIKKLLLVTSSYHTHRAASIFRRVLGPSIEVRSMAAPDQFFQPDSWWHNREGQKTVFYEYSRTFANWLGM